MNSFPISTDNSPPLILELIYQLKIHDVMSRDLITARRDDSLRSLQKKMKENGITGVPIVENGRLFGIVSMDDVIRALDGGYIEDKAENRMSRNLIVLEADMPLSFAISYFDKYRYGRFPVLDKHKKVVGIITSRDVILTLLMEVNKEIERLEKQVESKRSGRESETELHRLYRIRKFDFEHAGRASTEIKKILKSMDFDPRLIRKAAIASYELEMNQVLHSNGGTISFAKEGDTIEIIAEDIGPGIEDVEQALEEGYSTATDWIRSLGFGAGMGLSNVRRVSDEFDINSKPSTGTRVRSIIFLEKPS